MDTATLRKYGIDYEKGLRNCMGKPDFYKKILGMFLNDTCFSRALTAREKQSQRELFTCMHEMKGISGNAAMEDLYHATTPLVELLRPGNADWADVERLFAAVQEAYDRACEGSRLIIGG